MVLPNGLTIIDVAIGLVAVYVLMSVLCSSVNEGIETFVKMRGRMLERGIRELLDDPQGHIAQQLYNHPLVCSLFKGKYDKSLTQPDQTYKGKNLPSYIPSANFALAMLDLVLPATATQASGAAATIATGVPGVTQPGLAQTLRQAALNFPVPAVSKNLTILIDASQDDLVAIRKSIEGWYDSAMDRVAGWYKRRTQKILFLVGLVLAGALNVDTVHIANRLLTDPAYRNSLVATSQEYAKSGVAQTSTAPGKNWVDLVSDNEKNLQNLGVPVGWGPKDTPTDFGGWAIKIAGILATALATTLGAPFWFDLLNRFVVVRSTIKPQEKSQPEGSKD